MKRTVIGLKRSHNFLLLNPFRFYNNVYLNPFFEEIPKRGGREMRSENSDRKFPNRVEVKLGALGNNTVRCA
jgi:hypothetical protein